jgi:hypothetical protein
MSRGSARGHRPKVEMLLDPAQSRVEIADQHAVANDGVW